MTKVYCNRECINYACPRHRCRHVILDNGDERVFYHLFEDCDKYQSYKKIVPRKYSFAQLCKVTNLTKTTLRTYLCRAEFSHIKWNKRELTYSNVSKQDIDRLKELTRGRKVK